MTPIPPRAATLIPTCRGALVGLLVSDEEAAQELGVRMAPFRTLVVLPVEGRYEEAPKVLDTVNAAPEDNARAIVFFLIDKGFLIEPVT